MGWEQFLAQDNVRQALAVYGMFNSQTRFMISRLQDKVAVDHVELRAGFHQPATVSDGMWNHMLSDLREHPIEVYAESMVLGDLAVNGVKLFRPTPTDTDAFSRIEMRFPSAEYRQPFPTMVIDVPPESELGRQYTPDKWGGGRILSIAVRHVTTDELRGSHVGMVVIGEGGQMNNIFLPIRDGETMEDALNWVYEQKRRMGASDRSPGEPETLDDNFVALNSMAARSALNACLMLANFGVKRLGRPDELAFTNAERISRNKNVTAEWREQNRLKAMLMPEVFTIEQRIDLKEATNIPTEHAAPSGGTVSPHWRRAHWASQAHGPGGSLRKLVFRRASFVNRERFVGSGLDATATYTA